MKTSLMIKDNNHITLELKKTKRIHAFDSLRAIMMLLGLVLHSALTYNITDHGAEWMLKDPYSTSIITDLIVLVIHSFRMPVFFLVAGFFGSMLFYERLPLNMIKNRVKRIVLPFIVFLFTLAPILFFTFHYTIAAFIGNENPLNFTLKLFSSVEAFMPQTTAHLWFLYYLILITGISVLLAFFFRKANKLTIGISKFCNWFLSKPFIRILFLSGLTMIILGFIKVSIVAPSISLVPDINTFVYFFFFYIIGWILYKSKHLLYTLSQYDWLCTFSAILLVVVKGLLIQFYGLEPNSGSLLSISLSAFTVWLFVFGLMGLFIRYGSNYSPKMKYLSDASYWVYLIHLPIAAIIPAFIYDFPLPAVVKFLLVFFITTVISFCSYHYLVRNTFIGQFLNGRKYPLNLQK